jgi:outer membrane protein assembly factor BamB
MKKVLFFLIIFTPSCASTERFLPNFTPNFITKYFKEDVKPYNDLPSFSEEVNVEIIWEKKLSGEIENNYTFLNMFKFGENIYVPSSNKKIHIVSAELGNLNNSIDVELDIFSGVVADDNLIYFGSKQDTVTAVEPSSKNVLWQRVMSSEVMSISRVKNELIYVTTNDSKVTAIDTNTGKFIWINSQIPAALSIRGSSTPIVEDDKVYVGFEDGRIVSYNATNGDIIWQVQLPSTRIETVIDRLNDIDGSMILDNGVLYAISYQGSIAAIDSFNGQLLWTQEASSINGLASSNNSIFYIDNDGIMKSVDKYTGRQEWEQSQFFKRLIGSPVFFNDFIIANDIENYLHIFNIETGLASGRIKLRNKIQSIYVEYDSLYMLDNKLNLTKYNINKIIN